MFSVLEREALGLNQGSQEGKLLFSIQMDLAFTDICIF